VAQDILGCPVRLGKPDQLSGMADSLRSPSFSTSVGLLQLGLQMDTVAPTPEAPNTPGESASSFLSRLLGRFLPSE
jgi:cell division protein FtsA